MLLNYCFKNYALILVVLLFHLHICYTPNNFSVVCAQENISKKKFCKAQTLIFWKVNAVFECPTNAFYFQFVLEHLPLPEIEKWGFLL